MFFRKKKENKVTKEQIQIVKEIEYIDSVIQKLREDKMNLDFIGWYRGFQYDFGRFYLQDEYQEVLKSFTKTKINELQEKKMNLIKGND